MKCIKVTNKVYMRFKDLGNMATDYRLPDSKLLTKLIDVVESEGFP